MIKKMWALDFGSHLIANKSKDDLISDCVIHEKQIKKIKQIIITDEDPFKNVRKCINKFPHLMNDFSLQCPEVERCLKKDIKNWYEKTGGE